MTTHPPEPPAPWPPSPDEQPASQAERPGAPDEWRAFERPTADQRGNGHQAADHPPENGDEPGAGQPPGPGYGPDDYPDYPATPGYPDLPDYPRDGYEPASYPSMPDYPAADYPSMPDYPAADYPSMPDHPAAPDYALTPGYAPAPGFPHPNANRATPGSPDAAQLPAGYHAADYPRGGYPAEPHEAGFPAADGSWVLQGGSWVLEGGTWVLQGGGWVLEGAPVTHEEYTHPGDVPASAVHTPPDAAPPGAARANAALPDAAPANARPADAAPATAPDGVQWAMLAYLTVPFFGFLVPLAIYLISLRRSRWLRAHAAQAVNVWLTGILYDLSALIIGAVLILDSPHVALAVVVPLVITLWLTTLAFLVRAAARASRGETYTFPRWLCTPVVR
jgi:uncharacterized Tic20 family protein